MKKMRLGLIALLLSLWACLGITLLHAQDAMQDYTVPVPPCFCLDDVTSGFSFPETMNWFVQAEPIDCDMTWEPERCVVTI